LIPILIIGAVALRAHMAFGTSISGVDISALNVFLQQSVSFLLIWAAFYFLYVLVPNASVRMRPALISSFVFTLIFWGWQKVYTLLQFGVARYNAIYGVFAAVPVTFAWLYASWVIILLGAEFAFAMQNSETFRLEGGAETASMRARLLIALLVMRSAGQTMLKGKSVFDSAAFARANKVPIRLVNSIVTVLAKAGYLARVAERDTAYVLLRAADSIQVGDIVTSLIKSGSKPDIADTLKLDDEIKSVLAQVEAGFKNSCQRISLNDLINGRASEGPA
jgi:membrane protein